MTKTEQAFCLQVLSKAELFSVLPITGLEFVISDASISVFPKNAVLYAPHTPKRCIGILLQGRARVDKDHISISTLAAGNQFGAAGLYAKNGFCNTVTAQTKCTALFIEKHCIDALLAQYPQFSAAYIAYLSARIGFLNQKIEAFTAPNAEKRLLCALRAAADANGRVFPVCITELAARLNVSRAGIYRALDALTAQGILHYADKTIQIYKKDDVL